MILCLSEVLLWHQHALTLHFCMFPKQHISPMLMRNKTIAAFELTRFVLNYFVLFSDYAAQPQLCKIFQPKDHFTLLPDFRIFRLIYGTHLEWFLSCYHNVHISTSLLCRIAKARCICKWQWQKCFNQLSTYHYCRTLVQPAVAVCFGHFGCVISSLTIKCKSVFLLSESCAPFLRKNCDLK